jgi:prepilin-type N-terminal cleavage/methylation domain-containing protein
MDCKITFTKARQAAFTLLEVLVVSVVGLVVLLALMAFMFFSSRSFVSLNNYLDLDHRTQLALDKMSKEIRQVNLLTAFSPASGSITNLTFQDYDGASLQYVWNAQTETLTRTKGGQSQILLTGCDSLKFSIFQRTPSNSTFQPCSTTSVTNTKVVELTWNCSRTILGEKANNESMQSAKVVIRKR